MRHAEATVQRALKLYETYSYRDISKILRSEGIFISAQGIREWVLKEYNTKKLDFLAIPCFSCFVLHEYTARTCDPTKCLKLEQHFSLNNDHYSFG